MPRSEIKSGSFSIKLFQLLSPMTDYRTGGLGELKEESQQQQVLPVRIAPRWVINIYIYSSGQQPSSLFFHSAQTGWWSPGSVEEQGWGRGGCSSGWSNVWSAGVRVGDMPLRGLPAAVSHRSEVHGTGRGEGCWWVQYTLLLPHVHTNSDNTNSNFPLF